MLKTLSKYIQYSGVWVTFGLNPFHWSFRFDFLHPDDLNPKMRGIYVVCGFVSVRVVIDDGSW
jgi:hypothetical protein